MPKMTDELKGQINALKMTATDKAKREGDAISAAESRKYAIEAAIAKDQKDRSNAEKALVNEGHLQTLTAVYESLPDDNPQAPDLLKVIESLYSDTASLAAMSDDAPVP